MAAGAGYIEFATGDILTATAANQYLASQVVMVFASASARTSAIASPQEGMMSYLKDTNSTEYYSGSAWVAIGGSSGALTLITSNSFTSSSAVNINNCFSSSYLNYKIIFNFTNSDSGNRDVKARMRVSGADATAGNYSYGQWGLRSDGVSTYNTSASGATYFDFGRANSGNKVSTTWEIFRPFEASPTVYWGGYAGDDNTTAFYNNGGGLHTLSNSYDGFSVFPTAGNISGNYFVYGYSN